MVSKFYGLTGSSAEYCGLNSHPYQCPFRHGLTPRIPVPSHALIPTDSWDSFNKYHGKGPKHGRAGIIGNNGSLSSVLFGDSVLRAPTTVIQPGVFHTIENTNPTLLCGPDPGGRSAKLRDWAYYTYREADGLQYVNHFSRATVTNELSKIRSLTT